MINIKGAKRSNRIMKSLTGLTVKEFDGLLEKFSENITIIFREKRKVNPELGRPFILRTSEEKLFYILFYIKCYTTFDMAGWLFEVNRATCCRWTHWFIEALERTLEKEIVLPKRKIRNEQELFTLFPDLNALFIDGTERSMRRPQNPDKQKRYYSGKKKRHTMKNLLVSDKNKRVLLVSHTREGKLHDYQFFKDEKMADFIPGSIPCWVDNGFVGIKKDFPHLRVVMRKKKPKGKELTIREKRRNKKISSIRVLSEHTIGGVKRYKIVSDIYRNVKENFEDKIIAVASGLWNYHLKPT